PSLKRRLFANFMARDDALSDELYAEKKRTLFGGLTGRILEIGPGTGVNLRFLDSGVEWIGIEPNEAMHPYLRKKAADLGIEVQLETGMSEQMQVPDNSVDAVISTLVLCSVDDLCATLDEVLRVLKPGGRFVFLEHVADKPWTARLMVQKIVPFTPWRYFSDGCNPGRRISDAIRKAGFAEVEVHDYMQEGPGIILAINRPHIFGTAMKAA
ncbi:MAG TPA: class I SAM-dependent methyltransferase, partial [Thermohalobaculum sp.]|nr:class I SAM-dependent methyltransferase [Thermohalobaculum sp.]